MSCEFKSTSSNSQVTNSTSRAASSNPPVQVNENSSKYPEELAKFGAYMKRHVK